MSHRFLESIGVLAAVNMVLLLAPGPVAGQAPTAAAKTSAGTPPRTPWGEPDLQAIWDFATITPMERPKEHAGEVLTAEEAAEMEKQAAQRRVDRPPRAGDT